MLTAVHMNMQENPSSIIGHFNLLYSSQVLCSSPVSTTLLGYLYLFNVIGWFVLLFTGLAGLPSLFESFDDWYLHFFLVHAPLRMDRGPLQPSLVG